MISRIIGFAGMVASLAVVYFFESSSHATGVMRLFHWPAIVLTGLGPIALTFLCFDMGSVFRMFWVATFGSPNRLRRRNRKEAFYLHRLGQGFNENGPAVFETAKTKGLTHFAKLVIDRLAIRMPTADIKELSNLERDRKETELLHLTSVATTGVRLTPSIGMLGTIMGMVRLLATLKDPSNIGEHMSLALLTTFYGLFFSIAFWTPIQQKLEKLAVAEMDGIDQGLRWLDLIERKKPANLFADGAEIAKKKKAA